MDRQDSWVDAMGQMDSHPLAASLVAQIAQVCGGPVHVERTRALLPLLELAPGQAVLEVGCGTGAVLAEMVNATHGSVRITGVDPSRRALDEAARTLAALGDAGRAVGLRHMDGRALAFPNGAFAAALSSRVLIHAADPEQIVHEMARVVQPQGRVLCIEPAVQRAAGVDDALRRVVSAWTNPDVAWELLGIMRRAGLRDVQVHPYLQLSTEPPNVNAWRQELAKGEGLRAATIQAGRCSPEDVERLFQQNEAAIGRGTWTDLTIHFAVLGRKAL